MKIGYDAKRLFFNQSGLGNYSRSLVDMMCRYYPDDTYALFTPKEGNPTRFEVPADAEVIYPDAFLSKKLSSVWRSYNQSGSIRKNKIDLFHGLSNELPYDIRRSGARSVVTLHDIIFIQKSELYKPVDRWLYTRKYRSSCEHADRIIAISLQTKNDLINTWRIPEEKIDVVYQGCNPMFYEKQNEGSLHRVKVKYTLPERYILSVGTIEERKNLMLTVKAMVRGEIDIDLVAVGRPMPYLDAIKTYAALHGISNRLHFIHNVTFADLPAIYQMSELLVYASFYEGFGIPILEGFESGIPVITSRGGVFPETGGDAAWYVDPRETESMTEAISSILTDSVLKESMIRKGKDYAARFREKTVAANIRAVYDKLR